MTISNSVEIGQLLPLKKSGSHGRYLDKGSHPFIINKKLDMFQFIRKSTLSVPFGEEN